MSATTIEKTTTTIGLESITLEQIRAAIVELIAAHPADSTRIQRGARLLATATPTRFEAVEGIWFVASEEGETEYVVNLKLAPALACTCPDSAKRGMACKHQWSVKTWLMVTGQPVGAAIAPRGQACVKCGDIVASLSYGRCGLCCAREAFQN